MEIPAPIPLAPHSLTSLCKDPKTARILMGVISTPFFPEAREYYFKQLNKRVQNYHYVRPLNREQRRRLAKKRGR